METERSAIPKHTVANKPAHSRYDLEAQSSILEIADVEEMTLTENQLQMAPPVQTITGRINEVTYLKFFFFYLQIKLCLKVRVYETLIDEFSF